MEGRFPDFLIIGAMKCGTSSLHDYIGQHPDVHMSTPKELHFFDEANYDRDRIPWYKAQFASEKKMCGASPQNYTKCHNRYYQGIAQRIHQHIPGIKLIYIVRDPFRRIQSHVIENYYGEPMHDLEYNIESGHYAKTSMYAYQLSEYLKYFKKEQICVISLEELVAEKLTTMNKLFHFLGLSPMQNEKAFDFIRNTREMKACPNWFARTYFYRLVNKVSPQLANKITSNPLLDKLIFKKKLNKLLNHIEIENYRQQIIADVQELRSLTGNEFKQWSI